MKLKKQHILRLVRKTKKKLNLFFIIFSLLPLCPEGLVAPSETLPTVKVATFTARNASTAINVILHGFFRYRENVFLILGYFCFILC